ncbi:MAG: arsenosugar biosynthesis radical SAM (seleno)protein ArsS [Pseudomonadota bacterium]
MTDPTFTEHALQKIHDFKEFLRRNDLNIPPQAINVLQVNVTYMCNQACMHCHVQASPTRTEMMNAEVINQCLDVLSRHPEIGTLDLTGGAPELNPHFSRFVKKARHLGRHVIVRHNLTVTTDGHPSTGASMEHLPGFFAENGVEVVSSFPYFQRYFTDLQRGAGAFDKSIHGLKALNAAGYGQPGSGLTLNLVYNPAGAFLPGDQGNLEREFKNRLEMDFGIRFDHLYTITNMPIFRFREQLKKIGALDQYWKKLVESFNPCAATSVMCRSQISVAPDGRLYDCDFNQVLRMQIVVDGVPMTVFNFDKNALLGRDIQVAPHCFGCTAGSGSSCGGSTA